MPNQKISELTTIVTVDNAVDLFPIVDTSANTTKKITPTALKSALALDNVNNTSDANKPVSTAQQDALNAKVTANAAIIAATKTKVTYDAKGLVTAGDILDASDMPTGINAANIGTGVVSSTEFGYLDGVTSAIQTQLDAKQATLVSATNIKTINSTSILGSGDISISANPSGVSGAIQFSNGSAFASDAANLFWDDTNNRLGIGTNAPSALLNVQNSTNGLLLARFKDNISAETYLDVKTDPTLTEYTALYFGTDRRIMSKQGGTLFLTCTDNVSFVEGLATKMTITPTEVQIGSITGARLGVKGSGSTSATTSLLVQNSSGKQIARATDNGLFQVGNADFSSSLPQPFAVTASSGNNATMAFYAGGADNAGMDFYRNGAFKFNVGIGGGSDNFAWYNGAFGNFSFYILSDATGRTIFGGTTGSASAQVSIDSTTRGFLPPRMTTTQKNAIASPAAGLVVYDSTTSKLCCYNGSTWNDLF